MTRFFSPFGGFTGTSRMTRATAPRGRGTLLNAPGAHPLPLSGATRSRPRTWGGTGRRVERQVVCSILGCSTAPLLPLRGVPVLPPGNRLVEPCSPSHGGMGRTCVWAMRFFASFFTKAPAGVRRYRSSPPGGSTFGGGASSHSSATLCAAPCGSHTNPGREVGGSRGV
jgi:hypothetical protein